LPIIEQKVSKRKQNVKVLTFDKHLTTRKLFEEKKKLKKMLIAVPKRMKNISNEYSSSSESEEELQLSESSEECSGENENTCVECNESYHHTK
jgi:hypothetical protein